jgi:toxin FitB
VSGYLLDTNVVSEVRRPAPSPAVMRWFAARDESVLFLSVITLGEIRKGIERMDYGRRRRETEEWLDTALPGRFTGRVLDFDRTAALFWGQILGAAEKAGRPLDATDAQIAAIALSNQLAVVTGNVRDFASIDVELINPWRQG